MALRILNLHYEARQPAELPRPVSHRDLIRVVRDILPSPEPAPGTAAFVTKYCLCILCHCPFLYRNGFFEQEPVGGDPVRNSKLPGRIVLVYGERLASYVPAGIGLYLV